MRVLSLADGGDNDRAPMVSIAVLPKVQTLPSAETEFTGRDGNRERRGCDRRFQVRDGIVRALGKMPVPALVFGHEPVQKLF